MHGQTDLSKPTRSPNVTACVVRSRPPPVEAAPAGARSVLFIVSDDARPELPSYGQDYSARSRHQILSDNKSLASPDHAVSADTAVCLGPCAVHAPNLERLAGRGLTFIHAYCQQAIVK